MYRTCGFDGLCDRPTTSKSGLCWVHREPVRRVWEVRRPKDGNLSFWDRVPPGFRGTVKYLD
jgi:hypothetical protein